MQNEDSQSLSLQSSPFCVQAHGLSHWHMHRSSTPDANGEHDQTSLQPCRSRYTNYILLSWSTVRLLPLHSAHQKHQTGPKIELSMNSPRMSLDCTPEPVATKQMRRNRLPHTPIHAMALVYVPACCASPQAPPQAHLATYIFQAR